MKNFSITFIDGDDLHPKANINKSVSGKPLRVTDKDCNPWLKLIRMTAEHIVDKKQADVSSADQVGVVVACLALKKSYWNILQGHVKAEDMPGYCTISTIGSVTCHRQW